MKVLFFTHGYHSLCSIKAQIASYGPTWAAPAICACDAPGVPCSPGSANPRTGECGDYIRKHPTQTRPDGLGRYSHERIFVIPSRREESPGKVNCPPKVGRR